MLRITCPHCGQRQETEFTCGGGSHIARPGPPQQVDDARWADYLFFRRNPRGIQYEHWCHTAGCGQWFNVARHTVTHEIKAVYAMTGKRPELD